MSGITGIGWVPATSSTARRLRGIAPAGSEVMPFEDEVAVIAAIAQGVLSLTIVEAGGSTQALAVRTVRRVKVAFPTHPVIVWCDLRTMDSTELLDIAQAGPDTLVRHGEDELKQVFRNQLAIAIQRAAGTEIFHIVGDTVPPPLKSIFEAAVERARGHTDLDAFAAGFGITRRTLHSRLVSRDLPPTRRFLTWCRLMVAGVLLDQPGHTLDTVAGQLGFNDGHSLGVLFKRYSGVGINQLREDGVLDMVVIAFRRRIERYAAERELADPHLSSLPEPSTAD